MKTRVSFQSFSFIYTLAIFGLAMINISFALIGLLCYLSPLYLYLKHRNKTWCQVYCPRASFLNRLLDHFSLRLKRPDWLTSKTIKTFFIVYMGSNLFFAMMSTIMVALGRIAPMLYVRLFMVFRAPFILPQYMELGYPEFILHFSYRMYSMMLSSILIGIVLGILYAPRAWCAICPVNTLSVPKHS